MTQVLSRTASTGLASALVALAAFIARDAVAGTVTSDGTVTEYRPGGNDGAVDFEHAKPMPMPVNPSPPPSQEELLRQGKHVRFPGPPQVSPGSDGSP